MIEAAFAQLRFALSVGMGLPFSLRALDRIIEALIETHREFGSVGRAGAELLGGPALDAETQRDLQLRRFRTQARRAAKDTPYYATLFAHLGLDPARLTWDDLARIPPTPKEALRDQPNAFVCRGTQPTLRTTTTGTTGRPTSVCFSSHEMQTYIALGAINNLFTGEVTETDIVQVSTTARATLGNTCFIGACQRVGALVYMGGLVDPAHSLALLAEEHSIPGKKRRTSVLLTYPSYLGALVETGLRLGYSPADFGLERLSVGGEIVTTGLKARARQLFGTQVKIGEGFGMTETWPCTGEICEAGHLHFEPSQGLVEVLAMDDDSPAAAGELGRMVVTPLPPYRETTPVLRCDTQDLVYALVGPLTCTRRHLPGMSNILGKARLAVQHDSGWTTPRAVLEALEAVDAVPLPARCGFWAQGDGVGVEVVAPGDSPGLRRAITAGLEAQGVPVRALHLVECAGALRRPYPLRGDLREAMFPTPAPVVPPAPRLARSA